MYYSEYANAIRALTMDAVQAAASGHPGAPMGMAEVAEVLWRDYLNHNPSNPNWVNRDRFVLSNGHASMLLYSLLHLTGYDLSIEDIKNFRQLGSKTPGHPELGITPGVETTTGPLGQGLANAVGFALAEKILSSTFNKPECQILDHYTYAFVGDGCLMEGISHEAASFAGTQCLGKLICFYDDNGISIDGEVHEWFADDTADRFRSYNWQIIEDIDAYDKPTIKQAIEAAREDKMRPSLICCKAIIAKGAPNKSGTAGTHGSPLGAEEVAATRQEIGWSEPEFQIPENIYREWSALEKGQNLEQNWTQEWEYYVENYPAEAEEFSRRTDQKIPDHFSPIFDSFIKKCQQQKKAMATRVASRNCIEEFSPVLPELLGGSADLSSSVGTLWSGNKPIKSTSARGNYIHYGVREFAMAAIMNGISVYGGFIVYGATFLVFKDYLTNAMRLSALMKTKVIYILTHDSIGVGEDGPTHQPVEQLTAMRSLPDFVTWRPCDVVETTSAWEYAITTKDVPVALVLSRQSLPCQDRLEDGIKDIQKGGYILIEASSIPDLIIIATGSEVDLAVQTQKELLDLGIIANVVSMPSCEVFDKQSAEYRNKVLPLSVRARVAIEAGHKDYWYKYVGLDGSVIGMSSFGVSAPGSTIMKEFGFTVDNALATCHATYQRTMN